MKGARAVFPVTMISRPNKSSTKTMGASHNFFLTFKNNQNSLRIPILLICWVLDNFSQITDWPDKIKVKVD